MERVNNAEKSGLVWCLAEHVVHQVYNSQAGTRGISAAGTRRCYLAWHYLMVSPPLPMILPTMPGGQSMDRFWSPACGSSETVISTCLLHALTASALEAVTVTCHMQDYQSAGGSTVNLCISCIYASKSQWAIRLFCTSWTSGSWACQAFILQQGWMLVSFVIKWKQAILPS